MSPLIADARARQRRRRRRAAVLLSVACAAGGAAFVSSQREPTASASSEPSVTGCIATWNESVPPLIRKRVVASRSRHAYVAPRLEAADQVPLAHPLCTYAFPLADGKTLSMSSGDLGRPVWFLGVPLLERLSVAANATVDTTGRLVRS